MKSINFKSVNYKEYAINGDENCVIKINIADAGLPARYNETKKIIEETGNQLSTSPDAEALVVMDKTIREQIDYLFGESISEKVFGNVNCMSKNTDGEHIALAFLQAVIMEDMKAVANAQNITLDDQLLNENTAKYVKTTPFVPLAEPVSAPSAIPDVSNMSPEAKAQLLKELLK